MAISALLLSGRDTARLIMLLLLFLGTIFLRTVLANLGHAEESVAAANEYSAAEAGIRFADTNLTTSELGADWRPRASYTPAVVRPDDPDYYWIQPFDNKGDNDPSNDVGGYVRYNLGDSRFLLRSPGKQRSQGASDAGCRRSTSLRRSPSSCQWWAGGSAADR